ncbi:hypothetical protein EK616_24530 [Escherichia coli]|nr:hypothetical protein [Escherichia coli]EEV5748636.1 hypothetical protein [Escherichia coli]EEV7152683.1 hypothetical protein [Escherichia coli]EEW2730373.1 hypothetical protein [Escherichia coli]EEW7484567.1 hypothetical protein [Escherichia coli]
MKFIYLSPLSVGIVYVTGSGELIDNEHELEIVIVPVDETIFLPAALLVKELGVGFAAIDNPLYKLNTRLAMILIFFI